MALTGQRTDVLVVGCGGVGGSILELLAREREIAKIVACDVREEYGIKKVNTVLAGANHLGYFPHITFQKIDLMKEFSKIVELINKVNPQVVLNCTTMTTPWLRGLLPGEVLRPLYQVAGLGPWVSQHLVLTYRLMKAIQASDINPFVVNASYGDAVNPALDKVGLAPTVGMGNIDIIAGLIRIQVADKKNKKPRDVQVYLVQHHFNNRWFSGGEQGEISGDEPAPFLLKILIGDTDVTNEFDAFSLQQAAGNDHMVLDGHELDLMIGSSMAKHAIALLNDTRIFTHAPGPCGLIGGYPIWLGWDGAKLALPKNVKKEKAIEVNLEGQRRDGIQEIRDDGTIVFTEEVYKALKKVLNFDCKFFKVNEVEEVALEQKRKLEEIAAKYR